MTIESHYGGYIIHGRGHGREGTLIQIDWDYPATAELFGWSLRRVQKSVDGSGRIVVLSRRSVSTKRCDHVSTDGTVDCRECGVTASDFIQAAGAFLERIAQ